MSKKQIAEINIHRDSFHGEWNYTIHPISEILLNFAMHSLKRHANPAETLLER